MEPKKVAAKIIKDGNGKLYARVNGTRRRVVELEAGKFIDAPKKLSKAERKRIKRQTHRR